MEVVEGAALLWVHLLNAALGRLRTSSFGLLGAYVTLPSHALQAHALIFCF